MPESVLSTQMNSELLLTRDQRLQRHLPPAAHGESYDCI